MKTITGFALACALAGGLTLAAAASQGAEVTLKGDVACAHCTLHLPDAKSCQDVLQVTDANGTKTVYYFVKNQVLDKFGHTCQDKRSVVVTGVVAERDGKKWITASKIEELQG